MMIIWKMVTKSSRLLREMRMVSMKNERHLKKITALSNITNKKITVWYITELPALLKRLDSLTFKILSYS